MTKKYKINLTTPDNQKHLVMKVFFERPDGSICYQYATIPDSPALKQKYKLENWVQVGEYWDTTMDKNKIKLDKQLAEIQLSNSEITTQWWKDNNEKFWPAKNIVSEDKDGINDASINLIDKDGIKRHPKEQDGWIFEYEPKGEKDD